MKLITLPIRLLFRLVVLPIKLLFATLGLTFRTGFKVGTLPVKGGFAFGRALGLKALVLFALGLVGGVALTRRFGPALGLTGGDTTGAAPAPSSAGTALIVEDTVVIDETPEGEVVTEIVTIDEVDLGTAAGRPVDGSPLEQVRGAESEEDAERAVDIDAEVSELLGETPGEHA